MARRARGTGAIFKPKGSQYLWVAYTSGGTRRYESSGSVKKGDAQALLTERLGLAQKGVVVTAKTGKITIGQALQAVVDDLTMMGRSAVEHTERRITLHLKYAPPLGDEPARGYFHPDRRLTSVTTSDLTSYATHRQAQHAAAASINHELQIVKRAFRLALRAGKIVAVPYVPMIPLNNTRGGFFERDQFEAVREALPEELRGIVTIAFWTGMRKGEILALTWSQVDRTAQVIRLEPGTTKNKEARTLPYGALPELMDVIDTAWTAHKRLTKAGTICPSVFQRDGEPIKSLRKAWAAACETAGFPGKIFHDFRRTAVRNLTRSGVPENIAMSISGHKTRSVFDRYDIVNEADLRDALGKVGTFHHDRAHEAKTRTGRVQRFTKRSATATKRAAAR